MIHPANAGVARPELRHYGHESRKTKLTKNFFYHTMGLKGYQHIRTEYRYGIVFHHVKLRNTKRRCRRCNARWHYLRKAGRFTRVLHALPIGRKPQKIVLHGHEQYCWHFTRILREPIKFANGKKRSLRCFDRFIVDLCAIATIKAVVAAFLGVG